MYVKCFDTVMFYYVILVNVTFCHFQISHHSVPLYIPTLAGDGTQMTDAGIRRITLPGHCRRDIAGAQDKVSDLGIAPHGKPECSSGLPLVLHSGIPPG
ncbi:unnamed protein product, partial [Staurois parvus]